MYTKIKILFFALLLASISCTTNPFSDDDKIKGDNRLVSGIIEFSDQTSHENIYVWLEFFDIGTFTNESGNFSLTLPSPQSQPGGGVTGIYNLYFYVVNYKIVHVEVAINNGEFLFNEASLDKNGKLINTIILDKMLNVKTSVSPTFVTADFVGDIEITVSLTAMDSPVEISTFISKDDEITGYYLLPTEDKKSISDLYVLTNAHLRSTVVGTSTEISTSYYTYHQCELPKGFFEIIPFIWVNQLGIPEELINDFAPFPVKLNKEFLDFPYRRINAQIEIEHCEHTIEDPP